MAGEALKGVCRAMLQDLSRRLGYLVLASPLIYMSSQPSGRPSERVLTMLSTAEDALLQHDQPNAVKALRPLLVLLGPDTDEFEAIAWVIRELDGRIGSAGLRKSRRI